jgi:hypothetical protein
MRGVVDYASHTKTQTERNKMNIPEGFTEWAWTKEKPYPETLDTKVVVMFRDGYITSQIADQVSWWWSEIKDADNWLPTGSDSDIVAYKVVEN